MSENSGLLLAVLLSVVVVIVWRAYFEHKYLPHVSTEEATLERSELPEALPEEKREDFKEALNSSQRVRLNNSRLDCSINLVGARFDDLVLKNYKLKLEEGAEEGGNRVRLFAPVGSEGEYYSQFFWHSDDQRLALPGPKSVWVQDSASKEGDKNSADFHWDNGEGLLFKVSISLDDGYLFKIRQTVVNNSDQEAVLSPRLELHRVNEEFKTSYLILHQGPIGTTHGKLFEFDYKDLIDTTGARKVFDGDWFGFSDKYWAALIVGRGPTEGRVKLWHDKSGSVDRFHAIVTKSEVVISPGAEGSITNYLFAGAKELQLLDSYSDSYGFPVFDRVVDFGRLYFFTKPVFLLLQYFNSLIGNFGLAILLLTVVVKLIVLPLSVKSCFSMLRMRALQPEVARLKELYRHDAVKLQQKTIALFKKHGVNPTAGCLPALIQVPVFFSLYKVLFITLEMRHASFFGWIKDLSATDNSSVFTLFGVLKYDIPQALDIGVLPLILGFTMVLQQKANNAGAAAGSTDPTQANVMKFLPYVFTFLFASFPTGLIIYWIWNNILSVFQQVFIQRFFYRRYNG